ncbi:MAG: helix-turn-helix transcriptional regulator [Bdellovibrionota bacterium]
MTFQKYLQQVGKNIKSARLKAGLRQVDLEEKIGLNYRHYQNIEAGKSNLSLETLYRLAKLFKVDVKDLVSSK